MSHHRIIQRKIEKTKLIKTKYKQVTPNINTLHQGEILVLVIKTIELEPTMASNDRGRTITS
jgi:hypothetical protein